MTRVAVLMFALGLGLGGCATGAGEASRGVVFAQYSPLSQNLEIARRALPPLTYRRIEQTITAQHLKVADQAIDLAQEQFDLYLPAGPPPAAGYGLIVFIAPWDDPTVLRLWRAALDRHGLIFVAARRSGNEQQVIDRRVPLALLAYQNTHARYHIDDRRVYLWGFSGGSRTAEIVALAYPDIFHGVVLNAGADPIDGTEGMYKPPAELFRAFQRSRLVYVTGDKDDGPLHQDDVSQASMRASCVLDVRTELAHGFGHQRIDGVVLDRVLDALEAPRAIDEAELARCNARVAREIAAAIAEAGAAIDRGDLAGARGRLKAIDARFGGVAARELLELDARIDARVAAHQ